MEKTIKDYLGNLITTIQSLNIEEFTNVANVLKNARSKGKRIFIFGKCWKIAIVLIVSFVNA